LKKQFIFAIVLFISILFMSACNTEVNAPETPVLDKALVETFGDYDFDDYTTSTDLIRLDDGGIETEVGNISAGQEFVSETEAYLYVKFDIDEPYAADLLRVNLSNVDGCVDNLSSTYDPYMALNLDGEITYTFRMKIIGDEIDGRPILTGFWDNFYVVPSGVIKTDEETKTYPWFKTFEYSIEDNL